MHKKIFLFLNSITRNVIRLKTSCLTIVINYLWLKKGSDSFDR